MMETYRGVVHPWLCDIMGHLTTRHYIAMFDDASYHLAHACGVAIDPRERKTGFVDVKLEMDFIAELQAGALIIIKSGIKRLGGKSFTAYHEMRNLADDSLAATLHATSVAFDLETRKAIALSPTFRDKAAPLTIEGGGDGSGD
ncbi:acyl-CoA thioesterase [Kordiimonas aestuarii]|uniref:acyl-CoA thioesterase n=1 Tax=Kordiimonas aestuarii TaxID=1005925 RepID=UPI0021D02A89|nr:thioesterase family protein [Kordiimonas aestuarii]